MKYRATPFIIFSRMRVYPAVALALMAVLIGGIGFAEDSTSELTYEEVRTEILGDRLRAEEILKVLPTEGGFEWRFISSSYYLMLDGRPVGFVMLESRLPSESEGAAQWKFSFMAWNEMVTSRLRYPDPVAAAEVLHSFAVKAVADPIPAFTKN